VFVRGLDGQRYRVADRGERVPWPDGRVHVEPGRGFPQRGSGCGDLVVQVRLRGVRSSLVLLGVRAACVQQGAAALVRVVRRAWRQKLTHLGTAAQFGMFAWALERRTGVFGLE